MAESRRVWTAGGRTPPPPRTSGFRPDQAKVTSAQRRAGRVSQRPVPALTRPSLPRPPGSLRVGLRPSLGSDLRVPPQPPHPCEGANGPSSSVPHLQSRGLTICPHGCFQFLRVCEVTKDRPEGHQSSELPTFPSFLNVVPWTCSWEDSTVYFQQNSMTQAERAGESLEAEEETATAGGMLGEVGRVHRGACPGDDPLPAGRTESRATSTHPQRKACTFSRRNLSSGPKGRLELSVDVGATLGSFLTALRGSRVLRVACEFAPGWCNGGGERAGGLRPDKWLQPSCKNVLESILCNSLSFFFFSWKENSMNFPSLQMAPSPSGR